MCALKYELSVEQMITGPCDPGEVATDPLGIKGTGKSRAVASILSSILSSFLFFLSHHSNRPWSLQRHSCSTRKGVFASNSQTSPSGTLQLDNQLCCFHLQRWEAQNPGKYWGSPETKRFMLPLLLASLLLTWRPLGDKLGWVLHVSSYLLRHNFVIWGSLWNLWNGKAIIVCDR